MRGGLSITTARAARATGTPAAMPPPTALCAPCGPADRLIGVLSVFGDFLAPVAMDALLVAVRALLALVRPTPTPRRVAVVHVRAKFFDRRAAPGTGESAIQVPSARVAVVHDAGRVSSTQAAFIVTPVKVV